MLYAIVLLLAPVMVLGQTTAARTAFEVTSIKPNLTGNGSGITPGPNGLTARNVSLLFCIEAAYDVKDYQVSGPGWLNSEHYDIDAKSVAPVSLDQLRLMLQSLLADRFKLMLHRETRPVSVYTLIVGRNGLKLKQAASDAQSGTTSNVGHLTFKAASMSALVRRLSSQLHEPVLDMTGLKGEFDFTLDWSDEDSHPGPSLLTAVQEQLGLKLEAGKTPIEILVVDHAEKVPTEN